MLLSDLVKDMPDLRVARDGEFRLTSKLGFSATKGVLSYIGAEKYLESVTAEISCLVATEELLPLLPENLGIIVSDNPRAAFGLIHNLTAQEQIKAFRPEYPFKTRIGRNCRIHARAVIAEENVVIGDGVTIGANAVIEEQVEIGDDCVIFAGAAIGADGFEYCERNGKSLLFRHLGGVKIGNNVYIHPNACVAKALFADDLTVIDDGAVIDCLVHVGHAVKIGKGATVVAGAVIGGSASIKEHGYLGINSSVKQLTTVGDGALVGMGAVVIRDVAANKVVVGNPAKELG